MNYVMNGIQWNQNEVKIDDMFSYNITLDVISDNEYHEPKFVKKYIQRDDWLKWKDTIKAKLNSLAKQKFFRPVVRTLEVVKLVAYKWVFVQK